MNTATQLLLEFVLPKGIFEVFEITDIQGEDKRLDIHLEEKNIHPEEHSGKSLESKGFYEESKFQDFPIRDRIVFFHVKRRRWVDKDTGEIVYRKWEVLAKGTRIEKGFAFFFEGLSRY